MPGTDALQAEIAALEAQVAAEKLQEQNDENSLAGKKALLDKLQFINRIEGLSDDDIAYVNNAMSNDGSNLSIVRS